MLQYLRLKNDGFLIRECYGVVRNISLILKMLSVCFSATIDPLPLRGRFREGVCCLWTAGGAETGPELIS